jgi:hypothetical protein
VKYFSQVVLGAIFVALTLLLLTPKAHAQDNYEIQVYSSEATPKSVTMVEIHSNFTVDGSKQVINGVAPSNHAMHETLEITYGWTDWFETGFYVFSSIQPNDGWNWVGDHIRPRLTAPESWHLPVGLSVAQEIGISGGSLRRTGGATSFVRSSTSNWGAGISPLIRRLTGRCMV